MSLQGRNSCWGRAPFSRFKSLNTMNYRWRISTHNSRRMRRWCPSFPINTQKIKDHPESISLIYSIQFILCTSPTSCNTRISKEWPSKVRIWKRSRFKWASSGRSNSDRCRIFHVGPSQLYNDHWSHLYFLSTEKNGKTLHLLKANSKPSKSGKKRKTIPIMGTFEAF